MDPLTQPAPTATNLRATHEARQGQPDLSTLPRNVDRRVGAELVTRFFFPVSPRSLEVWPLVWRHVNGKAVVATADLFAVAEAKLNAAPRIRGGKRQMQEAA
ncbi:MAG: hypothetical protein RLZZ187_2146 [Pseudomonadota bacterium]